MPYVNIPESKLVAGIARIVGKIEGDITSKVLVQANKVQNTFRQDGCPSNLSSIRRQKDSASNSSTKISNRIKKFQSLPNKLKGPLSGLKAAIKVILSLPIPQSVPPGFGIPVNITTKFADILHLLKEFVKQIGDDINGLEHILKAPSGQLKSITNVLNRVELSLKTCEVDKALQDRLNTGELTNQDLEAAGLLDEQGNTIFSTLGPKFIGNNIGDEGQELDSRSIRDISQETGQSLEQVVANIKKDSPQEDNIQTLNDSLTKLSNSNIDPSILNDIKNLIDLFKSLNEIDRSKDSRFVHTGPNGTIYNLEIITDEKSPKIAPRRFAIAKDPSGVVVLKGAKSFSSSIDVLLDEIKFRIDNQLP